MRRALRVDAGISAAELAQDLGVSRQAVAQWERGERTPRGKYLEAYVEALDALADETRSDPEAGLTRSAS
jgi:transcriptional regulator with XRE-family HTH domain